MGRELAAQIVDLLKGACMLAAAGSVMMLLQSNPLLTAALQAAVVAKVTQMKSEEWQELQELFIDTAKSIGTGLSEQYIQPFTNIGKYIDKKWDLTEEEWVQFGRDILKIILIVVDIVLLFVGIGEAKQATNAAKLASTAKVAKTSKISILLERLFGKKGIQLIDDLLGLLNKFKKVDDAPKSLWPESYFVKKIDMNKAPLISAKTALGYNRNGPWFWRLMVKEAPEMFSPQNIRLIKAGKSPIVDSTWIKYNPTHQSFSGEKLIHHHIDQLNWATGLPESIHIKLDILQIK